jgi:hypothetical protein
MRWTVHEKEYLDNFETSFLCHHNDYPSGKQGGLEIIHHDERIASNGFLQVFLKDGRNLGFADLKARTIDAKKTVLEAETSFKNAPSPFGYKLRIEADGKQIKLTLSLDQPLSSIAAAKAWFELSLYPVLLWSKPFTMDSSSGIFPREVLQDVSGKTESDRDIAPFASGTDLVMCPDDPERRVRIRSLTGPISLRDERWTYEGEWYSLRTSVPLDKTGEVLSWVIEPSTIPGWKRKPMIGFSQAGYHPRQPKRAVIEIDRREKSAPKAVLERLSPERGFVPVRSARPKIWGPWLRYVYAVLDFSDITDPGIYRIRCGDSTAGPFPIAEDVLREKIWQPTLAEYFPVQMCHMEVWNGGRYWHAACHMDDAMQVPSPLEYIDGYRQAEPSDSPFKPFEHIPHLDKGGWHDAGDTDLAAGSQISTTYVLGLCREEFGADLDQTTVNREKNSVEMRRPDGIPDVIQQIVHGVESVIGGYRAAGHSFCGIIESIPRKYYQRGEVSAMTDNRVYDSSLSEHEVNGKKSGFKDDRYAFTNRDSGLEYASIAVLAQASRLIREWEPSLADECLSTAEKAWSAENAREVQRAKTTYVPHDLFETRVKAAVELFRTTKNRDYLTKLSDWREDIVKSAERTAWVLGRIWADIPDADLKSGLEKELSAVSEKWRKEFSSNPFGISWKPHIWGIGWHLQELGVRAYYLSKFWPALFSPEYIFRTVDWVLGCHPGNNVSFVSGVGGESLTEAFGINRADWSYIAGGNASGTALIRPDFPELKLNFPWLWQQAEYVMSGAATWIFCSLAVSHLTGAGPRDSRTGQS